MRLSTPCPISQYPLPCQYRRGCFNVDMGHTHPRVVHETTCFSRDVLCCLPKLALIIANSTSRILTVQTALGDLHIVDPSSIPFVSRRLHQTTRTRCQNTPGRSSSLKLDQGSLKNLQLPPNWVKMRLDFIVGCFPVEIRLDRLQINLGRHVLEEVCDLLTTTEKVRAIHSMRGTRTGNGKVRDAA